MKTWSEAFAEYLDQEGLEQLAVALALRVGPSKVHYWKHGSRPRDPRIRRKIQRWSHDRVPADLPRTRTGASA
jgi:hypothetical protein